jgi:hypothetical protein
MNHFLIKSILLVLIITLPSISSAQQKIKLTKTSNGKEVIIPEGKRVVYILKDQVNGTTGILNKIHNDSLLIDDKLISLNDITAFGKRKKGTGTWVFLMATFGGGLIGMGIAPSPDPCPSCNNVTVDNSSAAIERAAVIGTGITLAVLAFKKASNNSPKELKSDQWKLEIIE